METEHTVVGERDLGDGRFDYVGLVQDGSTISLKGVDQWRHEAAEGARVHDGREPVAHLRQLAAEGVHEVAYYLDSDGRANTRLGDGRLTTAKPGKAADDASSTIQ